MNWDAIRARLATACGWTPAQVGREVTLRQLRALIRFWQTTPPLAEVAAALLRGFKMLAPPPDDEPVVAHATETNALGGTGRIYTREEIIGELRGFFDG